MLRRILAVAAAAVLAAVLVAPVASVASAARASRATHHRTATKKKKHKKAKTRLVCHKVRRHHKTKRVCHRVPVKKPTTKPTGTTPVAPVGGAAGLGAPVTPVTPGGSPAPGGTGPAATPGSVVADQLAAEVDGASSHDARAAALLDVARGLHVGVYDGHGQPVVQGNERSANDLYLYDFELQQLADQFDRGATDSFDGLAAFLKGEGVTSQQTGAALTGAQLQSMVQQATQRDLGDASNPDSAFGLLIRDLGLPRGVDLAQPVAPDAQVLDPLQRLLIVVGLSAASIDPNAPRSSRAVTPRDGTACDFPAANQASGAIAGVKYLAGLALAPLGFANAVLDVIHGSILAISIKESVVGSDPATGHFGHNGRNSATVMQMQVKVEMLDQLPDEVIDCGALLGYTIPKKGPISGVKMSWDQSNLGDFGTVICDDACKATGPDGIATLKFRPDDEYLPGVGIQTTTHGHATANALVQLSNNNASGAAGETLFGLSKFEAVGWEVTWHQPRGYQVDIPGLTTHGPCNADDPGAGTCTFAHTFHHEEQCLARYDDIGKHPTRPRPLLGATGTPGPGGKYGWEHVDITDKDGNVSEAEGSFSAAIALDAPMSRAWFGGDAGSNGTGGTEQGQWVFTGPQVQASFTFTDNSVTPAQTTFPSLAVSEATDCPLPPAPTGG